MSNLARLFKQNRRWVGALLVVSGAGMSLLHFVDYGFTAHWTPVDHGIVGAILFIIGVALGLGKPGTRAKPPGEEEK